MEAAEGNVIDLSWVPAAGGPALTCEDGRNVEGMPETGWWVWVYGGKGGLHLHVKYAEPATGINGTLMVEINPSDDGWVRWEAAFLHYIDGTGERDARVPVRGKGTAATFADAHAAALAWRPRVQVIDGIELWTDPGGGCGQAAMHSGELTWHTADGPLQLEWAYEPAGLRDIAEAAGFWGCSGIKGTSDTAAQMLADVDAARERMRSALRKFLLNF